MAAGSASPVAAGGSLASTSVAQVLQMLESGRQTARVRFETELGAGEVDILAGRIVDAYLGDVLGRPALLSLLGVTEGHFEIAYETLAPRPEIAESVAQLLAERTKRASEWRSLCERAPALSSALALQPTGEAIIADPATASQAKRVLELVDGQRSMLDVVGDSQLDPIEALGVLVDAIGKEWCTAKAEPAPALTTAQSPASTPDAGGSAPFAGVPNFTSASAPALSGIALRKSTSIGLGIPVAVARRDAAKRSSVPPVAPALLETVPIRPRRRSTTPPPPGAQVTAGQRAPASGSTAEGATAVRRYVGRYELLCRIGYGGMGSVYLCRLSSEGGFRRLFALKVLRSHLSQDGDAAAKFLEEARLAGHVHHPNVVSVVDAGLHGTQPYLVMDYIEGASLKHLLAAHAKPGPPELIIPIILDALGGLNAAHTIVGEDGRPVRLVHCDVSPENLLVGIDGVCRLTDFGVARHGSGLLDTRDVAQGKPGYMAPEQIMRGRVDERTDIFAMGVVLYNALTAVKPFDAPTVEETLRRVCTAPIELPSTVAGVPPSLDFVCMKALERDPARRFASVEEMMSLLRKVALHEGMLAAPAQVSEWAKRLIGPELVQRRLAVLDLSRRGTGAATTARATSSSDAPPASGSTVVEPPASLPRLGDEPPPGDAAQEISETIVLDVRRPNRWALIIAAVLAALAVVVTLFWPSAVSRLFRLKTEASVAEDVSIHKSAPSAQSPLGVPSAPPVESR